MIVGTSDITCQNSVVNFSSLNIDAARSWLFNGFSAVMAMFLQIPFQIRNSTVIYDQGRGSQGGRGAARPPLWSKGGRRLPPPQLFARVNPRHWRRLAIQGVS